MSFPFSAYDFFGYLAAGFLVICSVEHSAEKHWIIGEKLGFTTAAFWVGAAYIVGHVVGSLSSYVIEHKLVECVIGRPECHLFQDESAATTWRKRLFAEYCKPLPKKTQERVLERSTKRGFESPGRAMYFHCHAIVQRDKTAYDRMSSFLNLYGFCRNVCMGALIASVVLAWGACRDLQLHPEQLWWAAAALAVSVAMFYRYLKFFRQYSLEVYVAYAELVEPP